MRADDQVLPERCYHCGARHAAGACDCRCASCRKATRPLTLAVLLLLALAACVDDAEPAPDGALEPDAYAHPWCDELPADLEPAATQCAEDPGARTCYPDGMCHCLGWLCRNPEER